MKYAADYHKGEKTIAAQHCLVDDLWATGIMTMNMWYPPRVPYLSFTRENGEDRIWPALLGIEAQVDNPFITDDLA